MSSNPNIHTATLVITTLAEAGLRHAIICPGSRSTPLTLSAHLHPNIETKPIIDERSAAFFALGMAIQLEQPVALICTSGTALANFYPAIIEANMSRHPLIILSADRPPELRNSGANQTIDQTDIYGKHVLWSVDMPLPETTASELADRNLASIAQRAYAKANGLRKGAVHLNFPFRKPLQPDQLLIANSELGIVNSNSIADSSQRNEPSPAQIERLTTAIDDSPHGIIVCGPRTPRHAAPAIQELAKTTGFALFADPLSGCHGLESAISGYEKWLCEEWWQKQPHPNTVIRFGDLPVGKHLNTYLNAIGGKAVYRFHIKSDGVYADDSHRTTDFWAVDEVALCEAIKVEREKGKGKSGGRSQSLSTFHSRTELVEVFPLSTDLAYVSNLLQNLPPHTNLFAGNSLPIRHVDLLADLLKPTVNVFGSRGASGIDGVISTAGGLSSQDNALTVLLIGDVSALHDLSGFLTIRDHAPNLCIVILNNDGGYIFKRLPIAKHEPPFTELFVTPHGLSFDKVADMFGLDYVDAETPDQLVSHLKPRTLIEVKTDGEADFAAYQAFIKVCRSQWTG